MQKKTLGIYGPAGEDRSGVVDYLDILEPKLSKFFSCIRVSNSNYHHPNAFDHVLYNIGNNLYHQCAFRALRIRSGPAIIHEFICIDYYLNDWKNLSAKERSFFLSGFSGIVKREFLSYEELIQYFQGTPSFDPYSADIRSESLFLKDVTCAVVHSEPVKAFLLKRYPQVKIVSVEFPVKKNEEVKRSESRKLFNISEKTFVFGIFGYLGEYKRIEKILSAWDQFETKNKDTILLVVGEKQYDLEIPKSSQLIYCGYIDSNQIFDNLLLSIDCGVQLRYPSLGETSGVISKLVAHSIPVIVSQTYLMSDLQKNKCLSFVRPGENEIEQIVKHFGQCFPRGLSEPIYINKYSPRIVANFLLKIIENGE